jgi:hypothetical protein
MLQEVLGSKPRGVKTRLSLLYIYLCCLMYFIYVMCSITNTEFIASASDSIGAISNFARQLLFYTVLVSVSDLYCRRTMRDVTDSVL